MKGLPMPISSPSRAENFPTPLMRFSRSNTASRSRGRSRASPMFYIRGKKTVVAAAEAASEPSSPKVTCFGQVRAVRAAKSKAKTASANRRRCWFLRNTTGNLTLGFRRQKGIFRRIFCNCGFFTKWSYCRGVDATEDSIGTYSDQKNNQLPTNHRPRAGETKTEFLDQSISVPKNALILTRCKSAPYRSSSLGGRIWGSPFPEPETLIGAKSEEPQSPSSEIESKNRVSHESNNESENPRNNCGEAWRGIGGDGIHPLLLTRSKSEPAKTGERLNPESSCWRQRKVESVEHYSSDE